MTKTRFFLIPLVFILAVFFVVPAESEEVQKNFPPEALFVAAYKGDADLVREILATSPDKDVRNTFGDTALHVAIFQKNLSVVKLLLDYGFDPNARAIQNGYTPLHNAVAANNAAAAKLLLQYRADKSIKNLDGLTPLDMARKGEKKALILLLYK